MWLGGFLTRLSHILKFKNFYLKEVKKDEKIQNLVICLEINKKWIILKIINIKVYIFAFKTYLNSFKIFRISVGYFFIIQILNLFILGRIMLFLSSLMLNLFLLIKLVQPLPQWRRFNPDMDLVLFPFFNVKVVSPY